MHDPLFADYCASIWDWETSAYIKGKLVRGQRIGKEHAAHCASYIRNYVRSAFPALKLSAVKLPALESFIQTLKSQEALGNRSINAIIDAMRTPLSEAAWLGLISANPADGLARMENDTREKGIPTGHEMRELLLLPGLVPRIRVAILLGSACALRLGEIQAIRRKDIGEASLTVANSWGKLDGLKDTKTGRVRIVHLPSGIRAAMLALFEMNPHGPEGFLLYGDLLDAPLDVRAIERGFDSALVRLTLGPAYPGASPKEKTPHSRNGRREMSRFISCAIGQTPCCAALYPTKTSPTHRA